MSYWTDNVHKGVSSRTQGVEGCEGGVGLSRLELFHNTGYVISLRSVHAVSHTLSLKILDV